MADVMGAGSARQADFRLKNEVYPDDGVFQLRQRQAHAIRYDGTKAGAHQILAMVFRGNCEGRIEEPDTEEYSITPLFIIDADLTEIRVSKGWWVVVSGFKGFEIMTDEMFRKVYQPIPEGPIHRG